MPCSQRFRFGFAASATNGSLTVGDVENIDPKALKDEAVTYTFTLNDEKMLESDGETFVVTEATTNVSLIMVGNKAAVETTATLTGDTVWFTKTEGEKLGLTEGTWVTINDDDKFVDVSVTYEPNGTSGYQYKIDLTSKDAAALTDAEDETIADLVLLPAGQVAFDATAANISYRVSYTPYGAEEILYVEDTASEATVILPVGAKVVLDKSSGVTGEYRFTQAVGTGKATALTEKNPDCDIAAMPTDADEAAKVLVTYGCEKAVSGKLADVDGTISTSSNAGALATALTGAEYEAAAEDEEAGLDEAVTITLTAKKGYFFPTDVEFTKQGNDITNVELESVSTDGKTATIVVTVEAAD